MKINKINLAEYLPLEFEVLYSTLHVMQSDIAGYLEFFIGESKRLNRHQYRKLRDISLDYEYKDCFNFLGEMKVFNVGFFHVTEVQLSARRSVELNVTLEHEKYLEVLETSENTGKSANDIVKEAISLWLNQHQ